jgi:DNA-binding IclR family transcriptional regulator
MAAELDASGMSIISKAERVLAALTEHGPMNAAGLSRELDEPVSSVYRIIRNMEGVGWVEKAHERGRFRLGASLIRVGQIVEDSLDVRRLSLPRLQELHGQTGESAYLCVRNGTHAVCIERIDGAQVQALELPVGGSMALHRGAASQALLAFETPGFRRDYLDSLMNATLNPFVASDRLKLEKDLDAVRESGIVVSDGDITPGVLTIAAPVIDHRGRVVASIALSALKSRLPVSVSELQQVVRSEAALVTRAFGGDSPGAP